MKSQDSIVYLSTLDEERFGIRIAKALKVTLARLPEIMAFCHENRVKMLIARCSTGDFPAIHTMERDGFLLMDTLVYYSFDFRNRAVPQETGRAVVRGVRAGEEDQIRAIAADSFHGYLGHYHADEKLDNSRCDEVYISWAINSCVSGDFADRVIVAELDGKIAGFVTLRVNRHHSEGEILTGGVSRSSQKAGVYTSLILHGTKWCVSNGADRMVLSSQITNTAVQKVWIRLGFEIGNSCYTFHKWFE